MLLVLASKPRSWRSRAFDRVAVLQPSPQAVLSLLRHNWKDGQVLLAREMEQAGLQSQSNLWSQHRRSGLRVMTQDGRTYVVRVCV